MFNLHRLEPEIWFALEAPWSAVAMEPVAELSRC